MWILFIVAMTTPVQELELLTRFPTEQKCLAAAPLYGRRFHHKYPAISYRTVCRQA